MSQLKSLRILFSTIAVCSLFTSCFKDVDFSQSQDIALKPDIESGLLFYQLNENDFLDSETGDFTPVIRDTVRLEFLDDDYIQDGLMKASFRFKHENTFSQSIKSRIRFLNKNEQLEFEVVYIIPKGTKTSPGIIDTSFVMEGENIVKVRRSLPMAVELEMIDGDEKIKGELGFSSKALFKFEF